jgi:mono/diheme cytochrome c family protein
MLGSTFLLAATLLGAEASTAGKPTFHKDIGPLVVTHCAKCHRPGEVAPFPLLEYDDVAKRAELILEVVGRHAMPPWKPVPGHGEFANGRRLSDAEIGLFRRWVETGAKEGDSADRRPLPQFADGWQLGKPDLVLTMAEPTPIPADGRDVYFNVILPLKVPQGKYIKAAEFRPGNRRVVHHAVLFVDTSGKARERDEAEPGPGFHAGSPPGRFMPGSLGVWTPGHNVIPLGEGLSMPWPDNADLVLNLHLHPSGKAETEQSSVGFYFTDEPPKRSLVEVMLIDKNINIAPGDKSFKTRDECELPIDMEVLSIFPHMHLIGKEMRVTATRPDGTSQPLFYIDDWDFNWQDLYEYAKPVRLPKGTKIVMEGTHDNSADNPQNPHDPPKVVRWGEQSFDEMSIAFLTLRPADEADLVTIPAGADRKRMSLSIRPHGAKPLMAGKPTTPEQWSQRVKDVLKTADKDGDQKLSQKEIVAVVGGRAKPDVIERTTKPFDRDGDGLLNPEEIGEALKALTK